MGAFIALFLLASEFISASSSHGQVLISGTQTISQNFNAATGQSLPTGWRIVYAEANPVWGTSQAQTTYAASSGSPTSKGTYLWSNSQGTDKAIGVLSEKATHSSVLMQGVNTSGSALNTWTVSYSMEEYYRNNSDSWVSFFYSLDGSSWVSVSLGKQYLTGTRFNSPVGYLFNPPEVVTKAAFSFTTPDVDASRSVYFRWDIYVAGPLSQGWGLDDVSITPSYVSVPEPSSYGLLGIAGLAGIFTICTNLFRQKTQTTGQGFTS
ncbi:MAG: hypothetical protein BGO12_09770 [Verrucomicrobia bacterium 61-8]|nr:MAG: hypothetical protein BGO12_09770 [Verrucomicrobia bacterium 61-8]